MAFCWLPPDMDRAVVTGPWPDRTSYCSMSCPAYSRTAPRLMKPWVWNRFSLNRWSTRFCSREKSSTRPCLCRSSGMWLILLPLCLMEAWEISSPHRVTVPPELFSNPVRP